MTVKVSHATSSSKQLKKVLLVFSLKGHGACKRGVCKGDTAVRDLIVLGADPNIVVDNVTPLQIATEAGDPEAVRLLLEAGANPNYASTRPQPVNVKDSYMDRYYHLCRRSSLFIKRMMDRDWWWYEHCQLSDRREQVKALLLEYGAEELEFS